MQGGVFDPEGDETRTSKPFKSTQKRVNQTKNDDPFANFKDFADLTGGIDAVDFSHLVVVYANKNSSKHEPRNILDQLHLIDDETEVETSEPIKTKALSKFKQKLRSTKLQKEYKKFKVPKTVTPVDYVDPLVADS